MSSRNWKTAGGMFLLALSLCLGGWGHADEPAVVDPMLDYYKTITSAMDDPEYRYSSGTAIYSFEADFTGDGRKSIFITDEERGASHGMYQWAVYLPLSAGGYVKLENGMDAARSGPAYIGPIAEIQGYGIVDAARHVVSAQFLGGQGMKILFLGKNQEAEKKDFPQYFSTPLKLKIARHNVAQLRKKYGKMLGAASSPPS